MNETGIMGGVFDPIHIGHLAVAEAARQTFNLDRVIFVPSARPPHRRPQPRATAEQRYLMTALAVASNKRFSVSRMELDRSGASYAIDTVLELRRSLPLQQLWFIGGCDALIDLPDWHCSRELCRHCRFIAVSRPGSCRQALEKAIPDCFCLEFMEGPELDISSSRIREMLGSGRSARYLLPEIVNDYIVGQGLYAG